MHPRSRSLSSAISQSQQIRLGTDSIPAFVAFTDLSYPLFIHMRLNDFKRMTACLRHSSDADTFRETVGLSLRIITLC